MSWTNIAELWDDLVDQFLKRWPATERTSLVAANGSQRELARHLADSHHLTMAEALEELDLWRAELRH